MRSKAAQLSMQVPGTSASAARASSRQAASSWRQLAQRQGQATPGPCRASYNTETMPPPIPPPPPPPPPPPTSQVRRRAWMAVCMVPWPAAPLLSTACCREAQPLAGLAVLAGTRAAGAAAGSSVWWGWLAGGRGVGADTSRWRRGRSHQSTNRCVVQASSPGPVLHFRLTACFCLWPRRMMWQQTSCAQSLGSSVTTRATCSCRCVTCLWWALGGTAACHSARMLST